MSDIQTLSGSKGIEKIRGPAEKEVCLFATNGGGNNTNYRPMATAAIEEDGSIWFFSQASSSKNQQIKNNQDVQLIYMDNAKSHYLIISGKAEVKKDKAKAKELWNPMNKAWFEDGLDDPELSLLKVTPAEGHYWDTKNGKLVTMIKIAAAAVMGKQLNVGVEGDIVR